MNPTLLILSSLNESKSQRKGAKDAKIKRKEGRIAKTFVDRFSSEEVTNEFTAGPIIISLYSLVFLCDLCVLCAFALGVIVVKDKV
jgi:hypothetical protein